MAASPGAAAEGGLTVLRSVREGSVGRKLRTSGWRVLCCIRGWDQHASERATLSVRLGTAIVRVEMAWLGATVRNGGRGEGC